jgi:methionyl-tRNA formyltransferase
MVTLRIALFGTPEFAVPTLDALLASPHTVAGVVTQPDRPRGRGHKVSDAPVKARAVAAGLPVLQPERLKDAGFLSSFAALNVDLAVVAAYGKILPESLIATPRLGMINVHASLLPRYRGAAPVHRSVIAGDRETGVTIMRVVKALDAGPMMATVTRAIDGEETSEDVERGLARLGADLLVTVVDHLAAGTSYEQPQDDRAATYAHRLTKSDGAIDWRWPAVRIHNLIRGLHPWPHAFSTLGGRRLILLRSAIDGGTAVGGPGTIAEAAGDRLTVNTGDGVLRLLQLQPEGKRALTAREFLAGRTIDPAARFDSE